jgi:hypothetical protein
MLKATQQPHMHGDDTLQAKNNIFVLNFRYMKNFFFFGSEQLSAILQN